MNCGFLGKSIAGAVLQGNDTIVQGKGVANANRAVTAGIFAAKSLEAMGGNASIKDKLLVMSLSWKDLDVGDTVLETRYRLVEAKEPREAPEGSQDIVFVGAKTNIGRLAGFIKARVLNEGDAVMQAKGTAAVSQTLKATMVAEAYIRNETDAEARLLLVPSFENEAPKNSSIRFRCFRA